MKYKIILSFIVFLLVNNLTYSHKEWVHQHLIWESYKFMRNRIGYDIPEFQNRIVFNDINRGEDLHPWKSGRIDIAAYREDLEDPIWGYGAYFHTWSPSSSHFWKSQISDDHKISIPFGVDAYNAFYKAKTYYGFPCTPNNGTYTEIIIYNKTIDYNFGVILGRVYRYRDLPSLFRNGEVEYVGIYNLANDIDYFDEPIPVILVESSRKSIAMQILGRMAHLLGDMSVPAHVHDDLHNCGFPSYDGDDYELWMGNNIAGDCDEEHTIFSAQRWTAETALTQGDMFWEVFTMDEPAVIRYLFFTLSQLSNHYPSNDEFGEHSTNNGTNPYIQKWYSELGDPPPISPMHHDHRANLMFNYAIRATATLFFWFHRMIEQGNPFSHYGGIEYYDIRNYSGYLTFLTVDKMLLGPYVSINNTATMYVYSKEIEVKTDFEATLGTNLNLVGYYGSLDSIQLSKNNSTKKYQNIISEVQKDSIRNAIKDKYREEKVKLNKELNDSKAVSEKVKEVNKSKFPLAAFFADSTDLSVTFMDEPEIAGNLYEKYTYSKFHNDTIINRLNEVPSKFTMYQNYPNPFNPKTSIKFDLPKDSHVQLRIYDINGKEVNIIINNFLKAGYYNFEWDANNYASGVYLYEIKTNENVEVKKMVLIK